MSISGHTEKLATEEEPRFCEECHICHVGECHGFGHEWPGHEDALSDEQQVGGAK